MATSIPILTKESPNKMYVSVNCCACYKSSKFMKHIAGMSLEKSPENPSEYFPILPLYSPHNFLTEDMHILYEGKEIVFSLSNNRMMDAYVTLMHDSGGNIQAQIIKGCAEGQFIINGEHSHSSGQICNHIIQ